MLERRRLLRTFVSLIAAGCKPTTSWLAAKAAAPGGIKWIAFYGETADEQALSSYDLVVLDPTFKGSKAAITRTGARLCGYLSLGEIRTSETFFEAVDRDALLEENPAWPGTWRVDVRHTSWANLVLTEMIPAITAKGFTGLLLDTLDTPPYLERQDPIRNRGMRQAAIDLVRAIRRAHPDMLILMNRGYDLLADVMEHIDGVVAESLLTTPSASGSHYYEWNNDADINLQLSLLAVTQRHRVPLPILSLDYWDPDDPKAIVEIYRRERQLGHHPYVAIPFLDQIISEPTI